MENLIQLIEALIFASDTPLSARKIKEVLELESEKEIRKSIAQINEAYQKNQSPLTIIEVAGGFQIVTRDAFAPWIKKLYRSRSAGHLTQRALETLAIIAYKQPLTKQEIEGIRGVNSDAVLRTLIERNLITITGRKKAPGNPLLYGTTKQFLEYFGLKSLKDLPKLREIDELLKSDDKFLESLDQVALQQMYPEELGLTSMRSTDDAEQKEEPSETGSSSPQEPKEDETSNHDATE